MNLTQFELESNRVPHLQLHVHIRMQFCLYILILSSQSLLYRFLHLQVHP